MSDILNWQRRYWMEWNVIILCLIHVHTRLLFHYQASLLYTIASCIQIILCYSRNLTINNFKKKIMIIFFLLLPWFATPFAGLLTLQCTLLIIIREIWLCVYGQHQTADCCLSQKQENYLILAYFSVFSTCSIAVANRQNINWNRINFTSFW